MLVERKVKSAIRGSKIGTGVMRAMASPPKTRLQNLYDQTDNQSKTKDRVNDLVKLKAGISNFANIGGSPIVESMHEETPARKHNFKDDSDEPVPF